MSDTDKITLKERRLIEFAITENGDFAQSSTLEVRMVSIDGNSMRWEITNKRTKKVRTVTFNL